MHSIGHSWLFPLTHTVHSAPGSQNSHRHNRWEVTGQEVNTKYVASTTGHSRVLTAFLRTRTHFQYKEEAMVF